MGKMAGASDFVWILCARSKRPLEIRPRTLLPRLFAGVLHQDIEVTTYSGNQPVRAQMGRFLFTINRSRTKAFTRLHQGCATKGTSRQSLELIALRRRTALPASALESKAR